jgi:tetratricopeptide (TPR) repeat protein
VATRVKKKAPDILDEVKKSDWVKFIEQVSNNPILYGAGAAFVLLCVIAGSLYRTNVRATHNSAVSQFARAMENEDAGVRAADLDNAAKGKGEVAALALYMEGEAAFEAKQYDKAREAFERLRKEYPDSANVPDAVEGLGNLAENDTQYDKALASYQEIVEKWPATFAARRQELNIGRCQEHLGKLTEAVAAYQAQVDRFPGSELEKQAKEALGRLRKSNPDLFPKEEEKPAESQPAATPSATPEKPAEPAPAEKPAEVTPQAQPAEQAPAEKPAETPAEPAPAQQ